MPKTLEDRVRLAATRPERIVPDSGIVVEHREGLVATVDESANHRIALPPSHSVALSLEWSSTTKSSVAYPLSRGTGDSTDKTTARIDSLCSCNQTWFGSSVAKREAT